MGWSWYFIVAYIVLQLPKAIASKRRANFEPFSPQWYIWHRAYKVLMYAGFGLLIILLALSVINLLTSST